MTRQEAIEVIKKNKPTSDPRECGKKLCEACDVAIAALQENDRKHAHWICTWNKETDTTLIECSRCGDDRTVSGCYEEWKDEYCPFCGAIMENGEEL